MVINEKFGLDTLKASAGPNFYKFNHKNIKPLFLKSSPTFELNV